MEQWTVWAEWLHTNLGFGVGTVTRVAQSLVLLVVVLGLRWLVMRWAGGMAKPGSKRWYRLRKISSYVASGVVIAGLGLVWIEGFRQLTTFFGLLSAGVAVALKDWLVNLAAWSFILWRRPFDVGDRIEIGELKGDVVDIRLFQFSLLEVGGWVDADQSTGRLVHVPNGLVFTRPLVNYDRGLGFVWHEVPVLVTFESDWRRAREILLSLGEEHGHVPSEEARAKLERLTEKFLIVYHHLTPTVYVSVRDSGVLLTLRFLCQPRRRRGTEEAIWTGILDAFAAEEQVHLAYPTQRLMVDRHEG